MVHHWITHRLIPATFGLIVFFGVTALPASAAPEGTSPERSGVCDKSGVVAIVTSRLDRRTMNVEVCPARQGIATESAPVVPGTGTGPVVLTARTSAHEDGSVDVTWHIGPKAVMSSAMARGKLLDHGKWLNHPRRAKHLQLADAINGR